MLEKKKKLTILIGTIIFTSFIAGVYGIIHDQITFSISNQYFTKFKFNQFDIGQAVPYRLGVTYIGFLATWWTGLLIGIIFGITAFLLYNMHSMKIVIKKALSLTFLISFFFACIGYIWGIIIAKNPTTINGLFISKDLTDIHGFIIVGTIHNFSYLGGLVGLITSEIWLINNRNKK